MDQVVDRPETETCAKRTLAGILSTGALLAAAAFVSVLAVDLPIPAGATNSPGTAQPYVPASDTWIELGVERSAAPPESDRLQADLLRQPVGASSAAPARGGEQRLSRRKPRATQAAALPARPRPALIGPAPTEKDRT